MPVARANGEAQVAIGGFGEGQVVGGGGFGGHDELLVRELR
jgi:hypothetical protein